MTALLADAQLVLAVLLVANTGALAALGADEIDVGGIDSGLLADNATLLVSSAGLDSLLDDGDALDNDLALRRHGTQDNALLAAVLTGEHLDLVALLDVHSHVYLP